MNELISLQTKTLAGNTVDTVSARELHTFLENGDKFSDWFKDRVNQYGFQEGTDFVGVYQKPVSNQSSTENTEKPSGGRPSLEYYITLDMAKELAMVERNEKGKQARRYFIECERKAKAQISTPVTGILSAPAADFTALVGAMKAIGLDTNAAAISANQAVLTTTGVNILQLTGNTHLLAEKQERWYTPTELGRMCDPAINPRNINLLLAAHDLQVKTGDVWVALQAGEEYSRLFDTGKRRGDGVPVLQLKWSNRVLDIIMPKR